MEKFQITKIKSTRILNANEEKEIKGGGTPTDPFAVKECWLFTNQGTKELVDNCDYYRSQGLVCICK